MPGTDLGWKLKELLPLPDVQHVVLLSEDGLLHSKTDGIRQDDADLISAACAGHQSLAKGIGERFFRTTHPETTMLQYKQGYLVALKAAEGTVLVVLTGPAPDMTLLVGRMNGLISSVGEHLATEPRLGGEAPA